MSVVTESFCPTRCNRSLRAVSAVGGEDVAGLVVGVLCYVALAVRDRCKPTLRSVAVPGHVAQSVGLRAQVDERIITSKLAESRSTAPKNYLQHSRLLQQPQMYSPASLQQVSHICQSLCKWHGLQVLDVPLRRSQC